MSESGRKHTQLNKYCPYDRISIISNSINPENSVEILANLRALEKALSFAQVKNSSLTPPTL